MKYKNSKDMQELEEDIGVQARASMPSSDQTWTHTHDGDHHSSSCLLLRATGEDPIQASLLGLKTAVFMSSPFCVSTCVHISCPCKDQSYWIRA